AVRLIKSTLGCLLPPLKIRPGGDADMKMAPTLEDDLKAAESGHAALVTAELANKRSLANQAVCRKVITALFLASSHPDLADEVDGLVDGVCRYFAVAIALCPPAEEGFPKPVHAEEVLLDVAIDALCQGEKPRGDKKPPMVYTLPPLQIFLDFLNSLAPTEELAKLPVFDNITRMLCHLCYQRPWWQKVAGCVGLQILIPRMPVSCLLSVELSVSRALVAIWRDSASDEVAITAEKAYATLAMVLHRCHGSTAKPMAVDRPPSVPAPAPAPAVAPAVAGAPAVPLAAYPAAVAAAAAEKEKEKEKKEESKDPEQIAFKEVVGHLSMELVGGHTTFFQDALNVAEMEDQAIAGGRQPDGGVVAQFNLLRTHCVQLLRTAMASSEVSLSTNNQELRNQIILMFFKVITKGHHDAVIAAREGLAEVLQTQRGKAPFKDLLQSSLRPVLVNLADYRKLNVPLLEGLSRLLELLSSWFNVTLGEKLLDYLQKWAEPDKATPAGGQIKKASDEPKIPAAIIQLFHLLPPAPEKFMQKLAQLTIDLELKLPSVGDFSQVRSPYRAPLTKFLNRFPSEALDFFYGKLTEPQYCKLFQHILRSETASPLRDEVRRSVQKLLNHTFLKDPAHADYHELRFQVPVDLP
ncbi:hypothetical protein T484DRAFT_1760328, partial [Baffinella frigidus]